MVRVILGLTRRNSGDDSTACFAVKTKAGKVALKAILGNIRRTILWVDLDGSFWLPVRWPKWPHILCQIPRVFSRLSKRLHVMAYLTGRASEQLGSFGMLVRGVIAWCQFGAERCQDGNQDNLLPVPAGLAEAISALDDTKYSVERKTHAVAIHWTKDTSKDEVGQLLAQVQALAEQYGLAFHPGNLVVELSPLGLSKKVSAAAFARQFLSDEVLSDFVAGFTVEERAVYEQIRKSSGKPRWTLRRALGALIRALFFKGSPRFMYVGDSEPDMGVALLFKYLRDRGYFVLLVAVAGYPPLEELADIVVDSPTGATAIIQELEIHSRPGWQRMLRRDHAGLAA